MRFSAVLMLALAVVPTFAQTPAPDSSSAQQPAPAAPAPPAPPPQTFSYKGFNASGWIDTYYMSNSNNPPGNGSQLQGLTLSNNKVSLNNLTGSFSYDPKPIGFRVDTGYGTTYDSFYLSEPKHTDWLKYVIQAYVSVKPAAWKGLQLDFGKFYTSAGAELTESHLNWNYSRSLLYTLGPFYHSGVRASIPVKSNWTVGGQLVTGWNTLQDNNTGKTMGFTSLNTFSKVTIGNNYYVGPENTGTNKGWRNFYDLAVTITPASWVSIYYNLDIGNNKSPTGDSATFWGTAGAARFALSKFAITPRFEYYSDKDGFWTGMSQAFKEYTFTGEYKINESLIARLEYRRDWSDQPYFSRGSTPNATNHQSLLTGGFIIVIKPGLFDFSSYTK